MAQKVRDIAKGYALMMKSREGEEAPLKCNMSSCGGIDYFRYAHNHSEGQEVRIKALQEALREALVYVPGEYVTEGVSARLRAILEDSEK